ncbi:MAG: L,D-transpeptidase family protein [Verrucomicrobiota bacterium]
MSITPTDRRLIVSIDSQSMGLIEHGGLTRVYPVSTSKRPPSCRADSYGTPLGLHRIAEKIGAGAEPGMVFQGRRPTRHHSRFPDEERARNLITSRILRLSGLEPGKNSGDGCDSYRRYIYIHGTNHEDRIGEPFSSGCVEMRNADVIDLFERIDSGDLVWIGCDSNCGVP